MPVQELPSLDEETTYDAIPAFTGGQVSNNRANLLQATESSSLINFDIGRKGKLITRHGTVKLGTTLSGAGDAIQGLYNFKTPTYNYLTAVNDGKLYAYIGSSWSRIAIGGVQDNDVITFTRTGFLFNNGAGYALGAVTIVIDTGIGIINNGDTFTIASEAGTPIHTVSAHAETAGNTTSVTFSPALGGAVTDNAPLLVFKTAAVNNTGGYPGGTTTITIDTLTGLINNGDTFQIALESNAPVHAVSAHSETAGNTTSVTFSPGISPGFNGTDASIPYAMTQGVDKLYWSSQVNSIKAWDGIYAYQLSTQQTVANKQAPVNPAAIVWFQNRLIAAGLMTLPDTVYFSDFLDATTWDRSLNSLRVGGGDGDLITGLAPWLDFNLIVLRQNSIYLINLDPSQNTSGDPTQLVSFYSVKPIHKTIGCVAPRTAVQVDSDVWCLTTDGVRSVQRTLAAESQSSLAGDPLSKPIQDIIDRINLPYAYTACACYRNGRYILGLPLDAATSPNYIVVFNTLTNTWSGTWTQWLPTVFAMRTPDSYTSRMVFGDPTGFVYEWLDYITEQNEVASTFQDNGVDIPSYGLTRGLTVGDPDSPKTGFKSFFEFEGGNAMVNLGYRINGYPTTTYFDENPIDSSTGSLSLPFVLPVTLPFAGNKRVPIDIMRCGQFRDLQFEFSSTSGKLALRSISISAFIDSYLSDL